MRCLVLVLGRCRDSDGCRGCLGADCGGAAPACLAALGAHTDECPLAWRSWLSGAKGYTYGAGDTPPKCPQGSGGVWTWVIDREKPDFWQKAIAWESSFQMQYLHDFLAAIEWWKLEPAHELVRRQPDDVTQRMVLAKVAGRDFAVAYLPDNAAIEVNLPAFSAPLAARWFDPVRGHSPR